jgi:hypothetical protein
MALAVALFVILLTVSAVVIWQHASRTGSPEVTFGVTDAVDFIVPRLAPDIAARLGQAGVQRIVEWEIYYLQGLAQKNRSQPVVTVAGDYEPAVQYISAEIQRRHGVTYPLSDVGAVLSEQVAYLGFIGAIGDEAGGEVG